MSVFTTAGQFSVAIPLALGLLCVRKLSLPGKWLVGLLFLWLLAETAFYLTRMNGYHNGWISYLLTFGELLIVWRMFAPLLPELPVRWLALLGIPITVAEYFTGNFLNSISLIYEAGLITSLGILLFREMAEGRVNWRYGWSIAGLMVLFIGSSVYYSSYLHPEDKGLLRLLATAHTWLLFIVYSIFTVGIWRLSRDPNQGAYFVTRRD